MFYSWSSLLYHHPVISCLAANVQNRSSEKQRTEHLVRDQGAEHICPLVSHMDCIQRQTMGFLKILCGWETYGFGWCYVTLNPHHLPGGPGVQSLPGSSWIQHHWSSVIHGFLISPPSPLLFQLREMYMYKISCIKPLKPLPNLSQQRMEGL